MKTIVPVLLLSLSALSWADESQFFQTVPGRHYDRQGGFEGRVDQDGRMYGKFGEYLGRVHEGRVYDRSGTFIGREENGRRYDSSGNLLGRQDSTGRVYGPDANYEGRMDGSGRLYNNQGGYEGRIEKQ